MTEPFASIRNELIARTRAELSAEFDFDRPTFVHCARGSVDVMGGIAEIAGSPVLRTPLDLAAAAIVQPRLQDRAIQLFSFDEFDAHRPFTLRTSLDKLIGDDIAALRIALNQPGRAWATAAIGAIASLSEGNRKRFHDGAMRGFNVAIVNRVPANRGLGAAAAEWVAVNRSLSEAANVPDSVASIVLDLRDATPAMIAASRSATPFGLPEAVRLIALRCELATENKLDRARELELSSIATHGTILSKMRDVGRAANRELIADPMNGQLGNLDADDYKRFFRPTLSEKQQHVADHFVLEPKRVREFVRAIEQAATVPPRTREAGRWLDRAGHLMYASDFSYRHDAMLSSPEYEFLIDAIHAREKAGIYGARLAGRGADDGVVVLLAEDNPAVDAAIEQIMDQYFNEFAKRITRIPLFTIR